MPGNIRWPVHIAGLFPSPNLGKKRALLFIGSPERGFLLVPVSWDVLQLHFRFPGIVGIAFPLLQGPWENGLSNVAFSRDVVARSLGLLQRTNFVMFKPPSPPGLSPNKYIYIYMYIYII